MQKKRSKSEEMDDSIRGLKSNGIAVAIVVLSSSLLSFFMMLWKKKISNALISILTSFNFWIFICSHQLLISIGK